MREMINQVKFANFKNLSDVTVDLEPFTLLVGPNGVGKTTVLQGIYSLHPPAILLELNAVELARPAVASVAAPPPGAPLAAVINYYAAYPDAKRALEDAVRQIVPQFRRVLVEPISVNKNFPAVEVPVEEEGGHQLVVEMNTGRIPADQASDGTLLALGLAAAVHHPQRPKLLLIDNIDRGLHIEAQVRLMQVLRALMAQDPELQIIATTHSPYLLQEAQAHEVRVMGLGPQGPVCRKLTEHPDFERMKTFMDTGEIWAALGEDWVPESAKAVELTQPADPR